MCYLSAVSGVLIAGRLLLGLVKNPMQLVRDIMTANVLCVSEDECLARVYDLMLNKHIRHVPVVDSERKVCGIITHRDLVKAGLFLQGELPADMERTALVGSKVYSAMSYDVETVEPDQSIAEAGQIIIDNKYGCLPVVEEGRLVGILTESDFVRLVVSQATAQDSELNEIKDVMRASIILGSGDAHRGMRAARRVWNSFVPGSSTRS